MTNKNTYTSTCLKCNAGCGIKITKSHNATITVSGDADNPVNEGFLCSFGKNIPKHISRVSDRISYPLMRHGKALPMEKVSWETAFLRASSVIKTLIKKDGSQTLAISLSEKSLLEEQYLVHKIAHQLQLKLINPQLHNDINSLELNHQMILGDIISPSISSNIDCFIISSSDISIHHPVFLEKIKKVKTEKPHTRIIYIGTTKNNISDLANLHLQIKPGTEVVLNTAIAHILIKTNGTNKSFINQHVTGYEEYKNLVVSKSLKELAQICGIELSDILLAAKYIQQSRGLITYLSKGLDFEAYHFERKQSFINLHSIIGHSPKSGSGIVIANDLEFSSDRSESLPIQQLFASTKKGFVTENKERYSSKNSKTFAQKLLEEAPKIIWLIHPNVAYEAQEENTIKKALENAKFVILQNPTNKSPFLKYADLILPSADWYEKKGTSNIHSPVEPLVNLTGETKTTIEILISLALNIGLEDFNITKNLNIYDEYQQFYKSSPSETYLHEIKEKFKIHTPNPLFFPHPIIDKETLAVHLDCDLYFTANRINRLQEHDFVQIHPFDADQRNLTANQIVEVIGHQQKIKAKVQITENTKRGVITIPLHLAKDLIADAEKVVLPTCEVQIRKFRKKHQKVVIIGAGSGALAFVKKYREHNTEDEIVVFSKELLPFYNRVMLPEYIAGHPWEKLVTLPETEESQYDFTMHKGVSIEYINKEQKYLIDSNHQEHTYDILVLGMGSKAFVPPNVPRHWEGVHTIRSKNDVDRLMNQVAKNSKVLVVGAGLISLEVAGAFEEVGIHVTLIVRGSRLMDRQLDQMGSFLLTEGLKKRGIEIYFNDEVSNFIGDGKIESIELKSGRKLKCDALVYGVGTLPNLELIKRAELECKRGVIVNDVMQTSDPSIFAIGEIIEWNSQMYGIVAAAEQQANVAASYLNGDTTEIYKGTLSANILKIPGINVCSMGISDIPTENTDEYEEVSIIDKTLHYYKKCIIHNDKLVGAILIGDRTELNEFKEWISDDIFLEDKRDSILRGSGEAAEPVIGELVCSCNSVGVGNLTNKIKAGCSDFSELCKTTGAGTGCGSCRPAVKSILEKTKSN